MNFHKSRDLPFQSFQAFFNLPPYLFFLIFRELILQLPKNNMLKE